MKKIFVLGGGIAGVTTAMGLKKLGFDVTIFYKKRAFSAYEGFSQKTKEGLLLNACKNASNLLEKQSLRNANWGETQNKVNYEFVVSRVLLDEALILDAKEFKIKCIKASVVKNTKFLEKKAVILYKKDSITFEAEADFIVDARGRFTPFKDEYINGPKSFSLLQELEMPNAVQSKTSIDSVEDGWIWQAYIGEKKGYIQFTCDEEAANKISNFQQMLEYINKQSLNLWSLKGSKPVKKLVKRDSFCKIHKTIVSDKFLLVGDSASSIDPLSGNGAFQALSMASVAPYVINTILNFPQNSETAKSFYKKRVEFIFNKFSKVGKEFYNLESRYKTKFWQKRQTWPKDEKELKKVPRIEEEGILKDKFIYPNEVVITKNNPMGVWLFNNIDVVDLSKYCLENNRDKALKYFEEFCIKNSLIDKNINILKKWLFSQKLLQFEV